MTVFVDTLHDFAWVVQAEPPRSYRMFSDTVDRTELVDTAWKSRTRLAWFQD